MAGAKWVYDSEFWQQRGSGEWVFNRWDIDDMLFEYKYNKLNFYVNSQVKYYNADNKLPQPQWINDLKRGLAKLKQLQTREKELKQQLHDGGY